MLKILICGDSDFEFYARAFHEACGRIEDVESLLFDYGIMSEKRRAHSLIPKTEYHFKNGLAIADLNKRLLRLCELFQPQIVFLYNCTVIYSSTVKKMRKKGAYVAVYSNDDPFSSYFPFYVWRHFKKTLQYCSYAYAYRQKNIENYLRNGAPGVGILKSYYLKSRNYYIPDDQISMDVPDVVFLGHMEMDERQEYIKALLEKGIRVGLNSAWDGFEIGNPLITRFVTDSTKYNEQLNKAKIAIVFLSKINHDTYTRRCFEIPAAKTLMIAPYTDDLAEMYVENEEAVFYRDKSEFVEKVQYYLEHENERERIAEAGYLRLLNSKNEAIDRVYQIIEDYRQKQK